ncbi:MAG: NUDIX hydrolase [Hydrogenoanaerobacterium sp.]
MKLFEKTLSTKTIFSGRVINLKVDEVELENGVHTDREVITHPGGVGIAALDENDCLLMVRQFRYPFARQLLEVPAGKLEYGEDAFACGKRELEEETGYRAAEYLSLGELLPTPAYDNEVIHLYAAKALTRTAQHLDSDEFLSVERVPLEKAVAMILANEIKDAKTQIAVMKLKMLKDKNKF